MAKEFIYTEEVTGEIVQIPANLLHHHHDNPRKDLGDLTELTESIRAKGILQNLTVVPFWFPQTGVGCDDPKQQAEMGYLVVIGNRRMEAAKAAGLETLPCIIAKMTPAEQVQTMLLENMQRSDLTPFEQAQGFQMMFDFGDSVETIAEKTGFSQPTIRRRLKMAELDQETLKEVSGRQLSLGDFDRLAKIEDLDERNRVLKSIGTKNFDRDVDYAVSKQDRERRKAEWRRAFESIGATVMLHDEIYDDKYMSPPGSGWYWHIDNPCDPAEALQKFIQPGVRYFYYISDWSVYIRMKKPTPTSKELKAAQKAEKARVEWMERARALQDAEKRAVDLRTKFVQGLSEQKIKDNLPAIVAFMVWLAFNVDTVGGFCDCWGTTYYEEDGYTKEDDARRAAVADASASPYKALMALVCGTVSEEFLCDFSDINTRYRINEELEQAYKLLRVMGYEMSDEEAALMDGTSDLYTKEGEQ